MNTLYYDGFLLIERKDNETAFIVDVLCTMYIEISINIAIYIVNKLNENMEKGYRMIDHIINNRK